MILPGLNPTRTAIIHDWLITDRGGERVLECLCNIFPQATLFALFRVPGSQAPAIERMNTKSTFIEKMPYVRQFYRYYLPLFPRAIESLDLTGFDLIVSSSHCAAKGVRPPPGSRHICYCHTPMRYAYELFDEYFPPSRRFMHFAARLMMPRVRRWDIQSSSRVGRFLANSANTAGRISRYYGRDSLILHPPVDTNFFTPDTMKPSSEYLLTVSALVPYKRVDRGIEAATMAGIEYVIVGSGPEQPRLEKIQPSTARFVGNVSPEELRSLYRGCLAFVLPGEEDFGIAPVEAQACGRPVIALALGGALETVIEGKTGAFFRDENPRALAETIDKVRQIEFNTEAVREHSLKFSRPNFESGIKIMIAEFWNEGRC